MAVREAQAFGEPLWPRRGVSAGAMRTDRIRVGIWLATCAALVFAMVVLGGVTRLTGSGLSMVDWDPIMGAVPPLSDADWQAAFERYREYPEFRLKNNRMDLAGFKAIFAFEYAHRMLGRLIGLVFFLPLAWFLWRRRLPEGLGVPLGTLALLGGAQGLMGWFMVKSGLVDVPHVSHYRLTAHLLLAVAIYAVLLWTAFTLLSRRDTPAAPRPVLRRLGLAMVALVVVTLASGGLVAGLKAGLAYNTFPLMAGALVPAAAFDMTPWWRNFLDNIALVQFDHRALAMTVAALALTVWGFTRYRCRERHIRLRAHLMLAAVALQVALGISTLLLFVPPALGAAHQAGGLLVFTAALWYLHGLPRGGTRPEPPRR